MSGCKPGLQLLAFGLSDDWAGYQPLRHLRRADTNPRPRQPDYTMRVIGSFVKPYNAQRAIREAIS